MRVPTLIPVAGKRVRVSYVNYLEGNIYAEVSADHLMISISKSRNESPGDVWRSVLHELTHVALDFSGHCKWLSAPKEEAIVHAIETLLGPLLVLADVKGMRWRNIPFPFED